MPGKWGTMLLSVCGSQRVGCLSSLVKNSSGIYLYPADLVIHRRKGNQNVLFGGGKFESLLSLESFVNLICHMEYLAT